MPLVLATDTSTDVCTVALCRGETLLAELADTEDRRHAERLLPLADQLLQTCNVALHEIDLFAFSQGPGSFTGLRIGASAWKGLAFAMNKPLIGVPTLDALALVADIADGVVCTALDARMNEVYGAVYDFRGGVRGKRGANRVCAMEALIAGLDAETYFIGDGAARFAESIRAHIGMPRFAPLESNAPRAACVAREAIALHAAGAQRDPARAEPVYLRASQAEVVAARRAAAGA